MGVSGRSSDTYAHSNGSREREKFERKEWGWRRRKGKRRMRSSWICEKKRGGKEDGGTL